MKTLTSSDRESLVRLASGLPKGDETRKAILAGLSHSKQSSRPISPDYRISIQAMKLLEEAEDQIIEASDLIHKISETSLRSLIVQRLNKVRHELDVARRDLESFSEAELD